MRDRVGGVLAALLWSVGIAVRLGVGRRDCSFDIDFAALWQIDEYNF